MTKKFKGARPLARLADHLPVRARVGLAVLAAELAVNHLRPSPNYPVASTAFDLARRWFDGERFDSDLLEDSIAAPSGDGALACEIQAKSKAEKSAWLALVSSVLYTAFHAVRERGEPPSEVIAEVNETVLDEIDEFLRPISPAFMKTMERAAKYLEQEPEASFAELKFRILEDKKSQ